MTEVRIYSTRREMAGWYVYAPNGEICAGPYPNEGLADEWADKFNGAIDQARTPVPATEHIDPDPEGTVDTGTVPATEDLTSEVDDAYADQVEVYGNREPFYPGEIW